MSNQRRPSPGKGLQHRDYSAEVTLRKGFGVPGEGRERGQRWILPTRPPPGSLPLRSSPRSLSWGSKAENQHSSQVSRNRSTAGSGLDKWENTRGEKQHGSFWAGSSCRRTCAAEKVRENLLPRDSCDPKGGMRLTHNGDPRCSLK